MMELPLQIHQPRVDLESLGLPFAGQFYAVQCAQEAFAFDFWRLVGRHFYFGLKGVFPGCCCLDFGTLLCGTYWGSLPLLSNEWRLAKAWPFCE